MKVLVIGDSCTDEYIYGKCERMCPDAPVPVFVPLYQKENKGMAGNVYQNLVALGLPAVLKTNNNAVVKTRYVDEKTNHMFLRIDSGEEKISRITDLTADFLQEFGAVVVSDYNKGFLSREDIRFICENHSLVFVDTKKIIDDFCRHCSYLKINQEEHKKSFEDIKNLSEGWITEKLIVTLGSRGCLHKGAYYSVGKVEIKDTSGAGDTFLAGLVYEYLASGDISKAMEFANKCATKVVQMKGVNIINDV